MQLIKQAEKSFKATKLTESDVETILEALEIEYIKYISSGLYADVFETVFGGKRVVVKITTFDKDFDNYKKLDEIKKSLPDEEARFLPNTYFFKAVDFEGKTYYLIGVEPLLPLDPSLKKNMFEYSKTHHNYFPDNLDNLYTSFKYISLIRRSESPKDSVEFFDKNIKNNPTVCKSIIKNYIENKKLIDTGLSQESDKYLNDSLNGMLNSLFFREFNKHTLPRSVGQMTEHEETIPETKSFVKFCKKLKKDFGISAEDIHPGNLMMRPNGDIVISDVGNFITKSAARPKLEEKYYQYLNKDFRRATELDNEIPGDHSRERIATEVFKKLNLPLIKELGSGVSASAFESFFGGKRICVKITQGDADYQSYLRIQQLSKSLGKDSKFLPKIFKVIKLDNYYVIISELLVPLDPSVESNLFSFMDSSFNKRNLDFKTCLEIIKDNFTSRSSRRAPTLDFLKLFESELDKLAQYLFIFSKRYHSLFPPVIDASYEKWKSTLSSDQKDILAASGNFSRTFFGDMLSQSLATLHSSFSNVDFKPEFGTMAPEKKEFLDFMNRLEKNHNILIHDLHRRNLMMRPNGDIVISDVGMTEDL